MIAGLVVDKSISMQKKPTVLSKQIVASTRLFKVEELHLRFSNGTERIFERLINSGHGYGAVMIVAMPDAEHVLIIEEYAAGLDEYQLSIPKGLIEQGEDVLAAANRELKEEAGFGASQLEYITDLTLSPNYMNQTVKVVLARELYPEKIEGDEPEPLIVSKINLNELHELSTNPAFTESRALAALYIVRDLLISRGEFSLCHTR